MPKTKLLQGCRSFIVAARHEQRGVMILSEQIPVFKHFPAFLEK